MRRRILGKVRPMQINNMIKYSLALLLSCVWCAALPTFVSAETASRPDRYERGIVEAIEIGQRMAGEATEQVRLYQIRFLGGPQKGQVREVTDGIAANPYALKPLVGDTLVLLVQDGGLSDPPRVYIEGYDRRTSLFWLVLLFVGALVFLSGWQGVKTVLSMGISIALIGLVLIPSFLRGWNPVPIAIVLCGVFTLVSAGFSVGWNRKALVTAVGTMGGALVAFLVSALFADGAHVSGLSTEEDRMFFQNNPLLDPRGLLFAGIIIAAAGVVEDVAVSIVSGAAEVRRHKPLATLQDLYQSGMTVGRDHMSALANTLVFAYVGASLSTLLLYSQFGGSWLKFMNFDGIVDEVIRSLGGTIGLVFTVPITAFLAAYFLRSQDKKLTAGPTSS